MNGSKEASKTVHFLIDQPCELASFEYYLDYQINIKSITLKSVTLYNSWRTGAFYPVPMKLTRGKVDKRFTPNLRHMDFDGYFSVEEYLAYISEQIKFTAGDHAKLNYEKNGFLSIELTEDKPFSLKDFFLGDHYFTTIRKWFGFDQERFTKKGKYYSSKPLHFYQTRLFLRSNLVDQQNTLYNNKRSDILCVIPVDDGEQIKLQRYEPTNCTKAVSRSPTSHVKFEITDEKGTVVNFRGTHVTMHFTFSVV